MFRRRDRLAVVAAALASALAAATAAVASFQRTATGGPQQIDAATLAAPTGLTATAGTCLPLPTWSQPIDLSWTATASAFANGQEVRRSVNGGAFTTIATLARTATSYHDTATAASTSYTYVVRATKNAWTSASGSVSATTKSTLCL